MKAGKRDEAAKEGEVTYFTGEKCKSGHIALRYTRSGACSECARIATQKNRAVVAAELAAAPAQLATSQKAGKRAEARREGKLTYFTGEECKSGHVAPRYVLSGGCSECVKKTSAAFRKVIQGAASVRKEGRGYSYITLIVPRAFREDLLAIVDAVHLALPAQPPFVHSTPLDKKERAKAKAEGRVSYLAVEPCAAGHIGARCTATGRCQKCLVSARDRAKITGQVGGGNFVLHAVCHESVAQGLRSYAQSLLNAVPVEPPRIAPFPDAEWRKALYRAQNVDLSV